MTDFNSVDSSDSRQTSIQILGAILLLAQDNETIAERIWAAPTALEIERVKGILLKKELILTDLFWGSEGSSWFDC